jgi:FdhD protein
MLKRSQASRPAVFEVDTLNEHGIKEKTSIAGEHPLTLYLDKRELVTLMTLGTEPELLSLGYLRNQRFVDSLDELDAVQVDWESESVAITSKLLANTGLSLWDQEGNKIAEKMEHRTVTTGCGQGTVFGGLMDEVDAIKIDVPGRFHQGSLNLLLEQMRKHESVYKVAGAVHGCALFRIADTRSTTCVVSTSGLTPEVTLAETSVPISAAAPSANIPELLCFVEDVGRHNAVDAIAGWMWLNACQVTPKQDMLVFYTTGRLTSEMVIKAAQMGIGILVSRSGLTNMGYQLARQLNMTLIGRCQGRHFLLFAGEERFVSEPTLAKYPG